MLVGRIAAPQRLDQCGGRLPAADHVFLALLLLHFEREAAAQDALHPSVGRMIEMPYGFEHVGVGELKRSHVNIRHLGGQPTD